MQEKDLQELINFLLPYIETMIQEQIKPCIKTCPATVISVDNANHKATVQQIYSTTNLTLNNNTGKTLSVGDSVILMWFSSMSNAWIGIKNDGLPWNI